MRWTWCTFGKILKDLEKNANSYIVINCQNNMNTVPFGSLSIKLRDISVWFYTWRDACKSELNITYIFFDKADARNFRYISNRNNHINKTYKSSHKWRIKTDFYHGLWQTAIIFFVCFAYTLLLDFNHKQTHRIPAKIESRLLNC